MVGFLISISIYFFIIFILPVIIGIIAIITAQTFLIILCFQEFKQLRNKKKSNDPAAVGGNSTPMKPIQPLPESQIEHETLSIHPDPMPDPVPAIVEVI